MSDAIPPLSFTYDQEEWRAIPSMPAYSVSSLGRVRRDAIIYGGGGSVRRAGCILKQRSLPYGHRQVTLSVNNKRHDKLVHRLVAEAFLTPAPIGKDCVCHKDDTPSNNRPGNLFWGDRADNAGDMVAKERQARGSKNGNSLLTDADVAAIRSLAIGGWRQKDIAQVFGCSQSNVSIIKTGLAWGHIP